jgi:hypothetical protein
MKTFLIGLLILLCSAQSFSQPGIPRNVEFALNKIEQAIRTGYPAAIEDLIQSGITMRIEDSLYQSISSITAMDLLKKFFANKDSIDFRFGLPGKGTMTYSSDGKRESTQVDVWLRRDQGDINVYALNISNYPVATVFFNIHPDKDKVEK